MAAGQVSGPPTEECPACGEVMKLIWDDDVTRGKSRWVLPPHTGDGRGAWGQCFGVAGPDGRMDPVTTDSVTVEGRTYFSPPF